MFSIVIYLQFLENKIGRFRISCVPPPSFSGHEESNMAYRKWKRQTQVDAKEVVPWPVVTQYFLCAANFFVVLSLGILEMKRKIAKVKEEAAVEDEDVVVVGRYLVY